MSSVFDFKVHPAAEIFPMMTGDELVELAVDIKANGLVHPLIVKDGVLIDGRNRREACQIAKVEPKTVELGNVDPVAYILSANINRRHMTKGQRAMAVAKIYPEAEKGGRGKKSEKGLEAKDFSGARVSQARTVLHWAPELADAVLAGAHALDAAYEIAQERKVKSEVPEKRLAVLRKSAPDLADKVSEDGMDLDEAEGAARVRLEKEKVTRQGIYSAIEEIERWRFIFNESHATEIARLCNDFPNEIDRAMVLESFTSLVKDIKSAIKVIGG